MITAATQAMMSIEARQSCIVNSHAASGAMVIGAMPMPAETSDRARLRCVSNQPATDAIIGISTAAVAPPTTRPKRSWKAISEVARLASARLAARMTEPVSTTARGPKRSERPPPIMAAKAMARKPMVMAVDMPVTDQPVSFDIVSRKTGSENIDPMATQPSTPPAATITQR
jgi:hypothetical protein